MLQMFFSNKILEPHTQSQTQTNNLNSSKSPTDKFFHFSFMSCINKFPLFLSSRGGKNSPFASSRSTAQMFSLHYSGLGHSLSAPPTFTPPPPPPPQYTLVDKLVYVHNVLPIKKMILLCFVLPALLSLLRGN